MENQREEQWLRMRILEMLREQLRNLMRINWRERLFMSNLPLQEETVGKADIMVMILDWIERTPGEKGEEPGGQGPREGNKLTNPLA